MNEPTCAAPNTGTQPLRTRLFLAGAVLLLEYLGLSFAVDAQTVAKRGGVWTVLGQAGSVGPLLVVAATALLLLPSVQSVGRSRELRKPNVALLAAHAALAALFLAVTRVTFAVAAPPPGPALAWMLGWASLGEWRWLTHALVRAVTAGGVLGLVAWLAGTLSTELWAPLSFATFVTVAAILRWLSFDLIVDADHVILQLDDFAVSVAPVCSGFEGIGLFVALMSAFLYRFRSTLRFPNALLLLPLGVAAVWLGNSMRIAALMILGARVDPQMAVGSFHSKAGWVFFCAITLAVAALGRRLSFFAQPATESEAAHAGATTQGANSNDKPHAAEFDNPTAPLLLPVLVWIGIGLFTSSFSDGHDPLYVLRVVGAAAVLFWHRRSYVQWLVKPAPLGWAVGVAVGVVWLLPLPGTGATLEIVVPGATWSDPAYAAWIAGPRGQARRQLVSLTVSARRLRP